MMICPRCGLPTSSGATAYAGDMCRCQWSTPNVIHNITDRERALSAENKSLERCLFQMQNAAKDLADEVQRLKEELLEQARIVGMSTDREYALIGKLARQEKVLKLALKALECVVYAEHDVQPAIAAIREVLEETK